MSWLRCDSCDDLIDTDEDPGAYDERRDLWLCASCRGPAPLEEESSEEVEREMNARQVRGMKRLDDQVHWFPSRGRSR